jgi:hypothetical protein
VKILMLPLGGLPSQIKLYYDRRPVGQSVLASGTHLGPAINFFFLLSLIIWEGCGPLLGYITPEGPYVLLQIAK